MNTLTNKRVLLGVTGGIAAYKSADLVRRLQDAGADVRVVMTRAAQEFITPLTMQALSGKPVHTELLDTQAEAAMGHIELARWADVILVAPASADFIAKLSHGEGGDLLSTLCLASKGLIAVAPAMNQAMWASPATQDNLALIAKRAVHIIGPAAGSQACGDVGMGRMLEPLAICEAVAGLFQAGSMTGRKVVITAGPTREAIDPVRYISNHSSGKMGYALAQAMAEAGAHTILVSGPTQLPVPERVTRISVESALEMAAQVETSVEGADVFIGAAAVADYRPANVAQQKLKKTEGMSNTIELVENPDIIRAVAERADRPVTVGFAAETKDVQQYAASKLHTKKLDMIIANDVSQAGIGFNSDNNAVWVLRRKAPLNAHAAVSGGSEASAALLEESIDQMSKAQLSRVLVAKIADFFKQAEAVK
ncbi:bifunctional phosphopantothenoylcysteine decarboxylase/phosphopantothenate--cysteine ligase CoaBC [Saccharophagus degradans]|uniref:Coenzyme A biosynthesis bifunctional protein CoaBC n=1 Tax=Saccharophagus degradans TaxID=86304 RepID=A0AAW7X8L8_9GAMM|nr:bifunctional phosphopantothenoylcysteine decarboxylase/phosphopantothenate--cysteine ligase CoaBC [Saccharophagus degradans]MDO6423929.1 bifunctional phosphopantothenoylcysteine decarboxylase/phosphopantothenate--cysteine ligase CoaBC [Saccharophagus degradans]MDO6608006.1 bifunctional phosphopantothenoylcysteine decarboxylase/phosphopantothenate--cysteine ligase CoaBC [Saccharophagus degradans]